MAWPNAFLDPLDVLMAVTKNKINTNDGQILYRNLAYTGMYIGTLYIDLPTIARMLKKFNTRVRNRKCMDTPQVEFGIAYAGSAHIYRYINWLKADGFKEVIHVGKPRSQVRCNDISKVTLYLSKKFSNK